ncbi:unnamed protein product [Zymoseptoria tritici ST99CH_1A5]|uniref:Translation initiation factor 3 N-terminal domain-containing protein n=2 Tax=Zymoseptoria tritici TaxID=1047171 RepID=A0A2H1FXJ4_ZYMTR|nr:unnamed protein product [Zymoseptoria tritici ST99CH_1E4]SMY21169.1 unnamed protein product [Zymoseptoria tritici ST99CH_1A5]
MPYNHTGIACQALFRVFVLPALTKPALRTSRSTNLTCSRPWNRSLRRPFSQSAVRSAKTRAPEVRKYAENDEIKADKIHLVDAETQAISEPCSLADVLDSLDPKTHRLVQFELHADTRIPVCKIISKRQEYEKAKQRKAASKEQRKQNFKSSEQGMKTLELNWAIDQNDLGHRLEKLKQFLEEGRRVEVVLAGKKKGRKATREECEALLARIGTAVGEVQGAKEKGDMEGKIGGVAKLVYLGKPVKRSEGNDTLSAEKATGVPASETAE